MIHVRLIAWKSVVLCVLAATGMAALADSSSVSGEPLTAAQAAAAFQDALAAGDADAARALLAEHFDRTGRPELAARYRDNDTAE